VRAEHDPVGYGQRGQPTAPDDPAQQGRGDPKEKREPQTTTPTLTHVEHKPPKKPKDDPLKNLKITS